MTTVLCLASKVESKIVVLNENRIGRRVYNTHASLSYCQNVQYSLKPRTSHARITDLSKLMLRPDRDRLQLGELLIRLALRLDLLALRLL